MSTPNAVVSEFEAKPTSPLPALDGAAVTSSRRGFRFWMVVVAVCVSVFLSALEFSAVSTALPVIAHSLNGDDFVWVASAYGLASTALLPASGGMADIWGRRLSMMLWLAMFCLGSALCGAAQNMSWLIAARTIQGAGGGGILAISNIIIADLVPLRERAVYNGLILVTWGIAAAIGPLVGGALAEPKTWRWLFYLNIPITCVAALLVAVFHKPRRPSGSFSEKLLRMDWIGIALVIGSSSAIVIGLTWGGVKFSWSSPQVLSTLIIGFVGMAGFLLYEWTLAQEPIIPFALVSNRTSLSGYLQTFIAPIAIYNILYFVPVYFQACWGTSAIRSGVDFLPMAAALGPTLLLTSATIAITKRYRQQLWLGWAIFLAGTGGLSTLTADSSFARVAGFLAMLGVGSSMVYVTTFFPVLAALPVTENAHALSFFAFCRAFASVWGVTIGTAVLQTQLSSRLPASFLQQFPDGVAIAYSIIPAIRTLEEPLRTEVRVAFADSLAVLWRVCIGITGMGLLASLPMKALPLHTQVDERWALEDAGVGAVDGDLGEKDV